MITATSPQRNPILTSFSSLSGRVAIFGGSFDPITNAHIAVAQHIQDSKQLDYVVFMPTPSNPLKAAVQASAQDRLAMLRLALSPHRAMLVSDWELKQQQFVPTSETLRHVRGELPDEASLHLIIGSDCLDTLSRWVNVMKIFEHAEVITLSRKVLAEDDFRKLAPLGEQCIDHIRRNLVEVPPIAGSSTEVRKAVATGQSIEALVPPGVPEYIRHAGLYHRAP